MTKEINKTLSDTMREDGIDTRSTEANAIRQCVSDFVKRNKKVDVPTEQWQKSIEKRLDAIEAHILATDEAAKIMVRHGMDYEFLYPSDADPKSSRKRFQITNPFKKYKK